MTTYLLIRTYPASPPINTIIKWNPERNLYCTIQEQDKTSIPYFFTKSMIEGNPINFRKIETELLIPIDSFLYFNFSYGTLPSVIYKVNEPLFRDSNLQSTLSVVKNYTEKYYSTKIMPVSTLNSMYKKNSIKVFETFDEAEEDFFINAKALSIKDIANIYKSAMNKNYVQHEQLKSLIKSKL